MRGDQYWSSFGQRHVSSVSVAPIWRESVSAERHEKCEAELKEEEKEEEEEEEEEEKEEKEQEEEELEAETGFWPRTRAGLVRRQ